MRTASRRRVTSLSECVDHRQWPLMEVYDYPQFSLRAAVCLYTDVKNGPEIRKKIVKAATFQGEEGDALRDAVNFAFVDARLVSRSPLRT